MTDRKLVLVPAKGSGGSPSPGNSTPHHRTLLLKDTTVGADIADRVTVRPARTGLFTRVTATLRKAITSDLTVVIKLRAYPGGAVVLATVTIPSTTAVDDVIEQTTFTNNPAAAAKETLTWDVTASDGSQDAGGVASFTLEWT